MRQFIFAFLALSLYCVGYANVAVAADEKAKEEATIFLQNLYKERASLLVNQANAKTIDTNYIKSDKLSEMALHQEKKRSIYLQSWAEKRNITLVDGDSQIRLTRFRMEGNLAKISLIQSLKVTYRYADKGHLPSHSFGIGTRHVLTLKKDDGIWKLYREWYLDPLDENPSLIPAGQMEKLSESSELPAYSNDLNEEKSESNKGKKWNYDREQAVAYANKYAGAAWGAGNSNRYNKKYRDYTYLGGDCTNYASQVIGDPEEGGGLRMTGVWRYYYRSGGSHPWVQTDRFKNFLLSSGYGRLVGQGTYADITKRTERNPDGAIARLQPGDLIAHEMVAGDVDHFSVVIGHDPNGYLLVNSHTADRYQMPFDLGWDKTTRYLLIHIND